MKQLYINHNKLKLLIVFLGFCTDDSTLADLDNCESDILYIWDYSNLDFEEISYFDFTPYTEINLIAYSYGVFAANEAWKYLPDINNSVAISGTIYPIDEIYGIKPKIFDLMLNNFNENIVINFKNKMEENSNTKIKDVNRTVENLKQELLSIKNHVLNNEIKENFEFGKVIITKKDRIFPCGAQKNFWQNHKNILELDLGHFPFSYFKDFDEILKD